MFDQAASAKIPSDVDKLFNENDGIFTEEELYAATADNPKLNVRHHWSGGKIALTGQVGCIQTTEMNVEILPDPKLIGTNDNIERRGVLIEMLLHYIEGKDYTGSNAGIDPVEKFPLFEEIIRRFLNAVEKLTRRGLAHAYRKVQENRRYLKGKLLMSQHLRYNFIHKERFFVEYQKFTANIPLNQLTKTVLLKLLRVSQKEENRKRIRHQLFYFDEVDEFYELPQINAALKNIHLDRTMSLYEKEVFPFVKMFLEGFAPATWSGKSQGLALLWHMPSIYEKTVEVLLRNRFMGDTEWVVKNQIENTTYYLLEKDSLPSPSVTPDYVVRKKDGTAVCIMDAKWKKWKRGQDDNNSETKKSNQKTAYHGIATNDMQQMYRYGKKYEAKEKVVPCLFLLYPKNSDWEKKRPKPLHYDGDLWLRVALVDLQNGTIDFGVRVPDGKCQKCDF